MKTRTTLALCSILIAGLGVSAYAASGDHSRDRGERHAGHMRDGGHHGSGGFLDGPFGGRICRADEPVAPRFLGRIESQIRPTEAQKPEFEALKAAVEKAEATLRAGCPTQAERDDRTPVARLALAEKRMVAALEALKTVRPPFDALYAELDDVQRDRLRWMGRRQ